MVVALGGSAAQIAVALKVKFLQVIGRVPTTRHLRQQAVLGRAMPPFLNRVQIGEKIEGAADLLNWVAEPLGPPPAIARLDVAPLLLDQASEIGEEAPPVRYSTPPHRLR